MINGSKISVHGFIATTLFRMVKDSLTIRNSVVAIKP